MESRPGGAFRDAENVGDLARLQPEVVAENEHGSLIATIQQEALWRS